MLLCALSACSPSVSEVPLDNLTGAYVLMVVANSEGRPLRAVAGVGLLAAEGEPQLPSTTLQGDETQVLLVSLGPEDIEQVAAEFEPERINELHLRVADSPDTPNFATRSESPRGLVKARLPNSVGLYAVRDPTQVPLTIAPLDSASAVAQDFFRRVTLMVPAAYEECRPPQQTDLRAFAAEADSLNRAAGGRPALSTLAWLSDDRLLVVTASVGLTWLDRGEVVPSYPVQRPAPTPGRWLHLEQLGAERPVGYIGAAAISPIVDAQGRSELLIVGGVPLRDSETSTLTLGWIRRGWLQGDSFSWDPEYHVDMPRFSDDVVVAADGAALVGTQNAQFYYRRSPNHEFEPMQPHPPSYREENKDGVPRVRATAHPRWTLIAGTHGGVHIWDAERELWMSQEILQGGILVAEALRFRGIDSRVVDDKLRIYMSSQLGSFAWRPEGAANWTQIEDLPYPPSFRSCASSSTGNGPLVYTRRSISALELQNGYIFMAHDECSALVMVKEPEQVGEALCVALLPVEGTMPSIIDGILGDQRSILASRPGAVAIASPNGEIYFTEW